MAVRTQLVKRPAAPWPRSAGWLVPGQEYGAAGANCTWLEYLIVRRSERDDGILEQPWASNRGTRLDAMTARAGSPLGSWWCGIWSGAVWADCGALVPKDYPATDAFLPHLVPTPRPGAAILYGVRGDAHHIGIVTRLATGMPGAKPGRDCLTREGNRGYAGSASNNGVAVDQGPLTRLDVLGFMPARPVPGWSLAAYAPLEFLVEHLAVLPPDAAAATRARLRTA